MKLLDRKMTVYLRGLATRLGSDIITAEELAEKHGKSLAKIKKHAGITKLHRFSKDETLVGLACDAAREAMAQAGITYEDVQNVYSSTASPTADFLMPGLARLVDHELGREDRIRRFALNVGMGCAGGIQALEVACAFAEHYSSTASHLVIVGDHVSRTLDGRWETAPLFSEGVAALVLSTQPGKNPLYVIDGVGSLNVHASNDEDLMAMRIRNPMADSNQGRMTFEMDGERTARFAIEEAFGLGLQIATGSSQTRGRYVIPHQASKFILDHMASKYSLKPGRFYADGIGTIGNTLGASVFFGLQDVDRKGIAPADEKVLIAFGAELAVGGALLRRPEGWRAE